MKREIKFRAWAREGDWEEDGDTRKWEMIAADSLSFTFHEPLSSQLKDKDDEIYFMQYTGLKDKNGKEIYEGDIVSYCLWREDQENYFDEAVEFRGGAFYPICERDEMEYKVIGNIYENPELLK